MPLWRPRGTIGLAAYALHDWGLHDFRRTLSTRLNDAGIDPHVVEAILGHAGAKRGVAGVYNRASYRVQKAEALAIGQPLSANRRSQMIHAVENRPWTRSARVHRCHDCRCDSCQQYHARFRNNGRVR